MLCLNSLGLLLDIIDDYESDAPTGSHHWIQQSLADGGIVAEDEEEDTEDDDDLDDDEDEDEDVEDDDEEEDESAP